MIEHIKEGRDGSCTLLIGATAPIIKLYQYINKVGPKKFKSELPAIEYGLFLKTYNNLLDMEDIPEYDKTLIYDEFENFFTKKQEVLLVARDNTTNLEYFPWDYSLKDILTMDLPKDILYNRIPIETKNEFVLNILKYSLSFLETSED